MSLTIENKKINIQGEIPVNIIAQDDGTFMADCPELDLFSWGGSIDEAIQCFDEVLELFLRDIVSRNVAVQVLGEFGWKIIEDKSEINIIPPFVVKTIKTSISNFQISSKNPAKYA